MSNYTVNDWIRDLRSGKYEQGASYLIKEISHGYAYCCLGLAACVGFGAEPVFNNIINEYDYDEDYYEDSDGTSIVRVVGDNNEWENESTADDYLFFLMGIDNGPVVNDFSFKDIAPVTNLREYLATLNDKGVSFYEIGNYLDVIFNHNWDCIPDPEGD